ncbi:hypothetical protein J6590_073666 [Homalodisca vitripennis]|nr:hypothetical protein J6590_073666 [Homalodisca vitripennis]
MAAVQGLMYNMSSPRGPVSRLTELQGSIMSADLSGLSILTMSSLFILEATFLPKFGENVVQNSDLNGYNTRSMHNLRPVTCLLEVSASLPQNFGAVLFNRLPRAVKSDSIPVDVKRQRRDYLVNNVFYRIGEFLSE